MKKIFNICLLLAVTAGFVACSDDNDAGSSYLRENPVKVVSSNLFFNANAQKGGVKFTAPAGSTVSVSDSWATAQLQNDSIIVSVTNNTAVDSRSTVLTIKNGNDSTNLPILQSGAMFKYNGAKYYVVSDKDTTLTLPYSKLGAEPTLALADTADASAVTSIEDKDSAFVAHVSANTTGELRTISLILTNQEHRDTITVTQGSIDDFVGKKYVIYGYDILKMTSPTTDINTLITQIVGKLEKKSDTELTFVSNDTGMKMTFYFDPANLSLSIKGGEYVLAKKENETTYRYRTAIWDVNHYSVFMKLIKQKTAEHKAGKLSDEEFAAFQKVVPGIYNYYASNKLSLTARMVNSKEDRIVAGILEDSGTNADYIKSLTYLGPLGFPINKFTANMFSIYEYTQKGTLLYLNGPSIMLQAMMIYHPLRTNSEPAAFMQKKAGK